MSMSFFHRTFKNNSFAKLTSLATGIAACATPGLAATDSQSPSQPTPIRELAPPQSAELIAARALVQAARNESAREAMKIMGEQRRQREEQSARQRESQGSRSTAEALALEASFNQQVQAGMREGSSVQALAAMASKLGNGAQDAAAKTSVAVLDALKQVQVQNDKSLTDMIMLTAVSSEERMHAMSAAASASSGMPQKPASSGTSRSQGGQSAPPAPLAFTSTKESGSEPKVHVTVVPDQKTVVPARGPASVPAVQDTTALESNDQPQVIQASVAPFAPWIEKGAMAVGGYLAGKYGERVLERVPELNKIKCKAGNIGDWFVDSTFCAGPSMGGAPAMMYVPEFAEMQRECQERANFELQQQNQVCDEQYETEKNEQAAKEKKFQENRKTSPQQEGQ